MPSLVNKIQTKRCLSVLLFETDQVRCLEVTPINVYPKDHFNIFVKRRWRMFSCFLKIYSKSKFTLGSNSSPLIQLNQNVYQSASQWFKFKILIKKVNRKFMFSLSNIIDAIAKTQINLLIDIPSLTQNVKVLSNLRFWKYFNIKLGKVKREMFSFSSNDRHRINYNYYNTFHRKLNNDVYNEIYILNHQSTKMKDKRW